MSTDDRCHEIRKLAPEVALGIADGEDRARVLAHAAVVCDTGVFELVGRPRPLERLHGGHDDP